MKISKPYFLVGLFVYIYTVDLNKNFVTLAFKKA
jgi:hypothetical protein